MVLRRKQKDTLFRRIVWLMCFLAVIWVAFQLKELPPREETLPLQSTQQVAISVAEGFEPFTVGALEITFQYPSEQAPLKAAKTLTNADVLLESRDFHIGLYSGPGFEFQPWPEQGDTSSCLYDGALHNFQSQGGVVDCYFDEYAKAQQRVLINSFIRDDATKHVSILPVNGRKYFMAIYVNYINDCGERVNVCEARSHQKREKLIAFTNALLEKNHNLFTQ